MGEQYTGYTRIFGRKEMSELLDRGVPIESIDKDGKTFLRHACSDGNIEIVKFLLERGADVNTHDNEGKTPLMSAAMICRLEVVKLLVEHGADPTIETSTGDSAVKIAQRWGKNDIVQLLLEATKRGSPVHDPAHQQMIRPSAEEGREQIEHSLATNLDFKSSPQEVSETLPSKVSAVSPRVVEAEVIYSVVRQESESRGVSTSPGEVNVTATAVDVTVRESQLSDQDGFKMPELTTDDYIQALEKMKQSPKDRIGILGSLGATGLGATAGAAASGSIAAIFGATTLLGSSTLGTALGAALITTTPVGWVIGSAAAAAAIGYGVSRLIWNGAGAQVIKEMNMKELQEEIEKRKAAAEKTGVAEEKFKGLVESFQLLVKNKRISQGDCTEFFAGIQNGTISYEYAFSTVERLSQQQEVRTDAQ